MDYIIPGLLGFLVGGVLFGVSYQSVFLKISGLSALGKINLANLLHVNHWLIISLFVLCTVIFYVGSKIYEAKNPSQEKIHQLDFNDLAQ